MYKYTMIDIISNLFDVQGCGVSSDLTSWAQGDKMSSGD